MSWEKKFAIHEIVANSIQFLSFFKMSIKLFGVIFLMTAVILAPINSHFVGLTNPFRDDTNGTSTWSLHFARSMSNQTSPHNDLPDNSYLWAYSVFTYVFTGLAIYFMIEQTRTVIQVRQDYLGSQSTVTDRTFKLSGIPKELRSEEKITEVLEKLELGKVESVTICRYWGKLDDLMDRRMSVLRRLEEAWTAYSGQKKANESRRPRPEVATSEPRQSEEINEGDNLLGRHHVTTHENPRPTTRLWYGFLGLQHKHVDAIDYYEELLRKLDDNIVKARKRFYKATPMAFVTMDSIPACQMAVQAVLDPSPTQLKANLAPAPSDIVWTNTYLSRSSRMIRSWTITVFILILTIIWLIPVASLAGLLDLCSIAQVWKGLADFIESRYILKALIQTGLPTLVVSLLNVAVPFLYDYLANMQGTISQGDVELSVISKNFFFTFFNVFVVFTVFGTASQFWPVLQESLRDTTKLAYKLAESLEKLANFYTNFILLQGVGLLPFRLLEFGSVSLYPITLMISNTPRDYAELVQPPVFKYGFYLPSALLVYTLCIVYSILPAGYLVLFFGLIYFVFGYFTYKYQLLYAMEHPQHSTGRAWPLICYRLMLGLGVFQLAMAGIIAAKKAFVPAATVTLLIPFTIWYSYYFSRTFEPLTRFISLRSIRRQSNANVNIADEHIGIQEPPGTLAGGTTIDEAREKGLQFINPSLVTP